MRRRRMWNWWRLLLLPYAIRYQPSASYYLNRIIHIDSIDDVTAFLSSSSFSSSWWSDDGISRQQPDRVKRPTEYYGRRVLSLPRCYCPAHSFTSQHSIRQQTADSRHHCRCINESQHQLRQWITICLFQYLWHWWWDDENHRGGGGGAAL